MTPGEPARLLSVGGEPDEPRSWAMLSFTLAPGYVTVPTVKGPGANATYWDSATLHPAFDLGKESRQTKPQLDQ